MTKSFHIVALAVLALALPLVALADTTLNLDTGTTGSSGGDILFNPGASISPQINAKLHDLGTALSSTFNEIEASGVFETELAAFPYSTTPISGSSLVANEVFAVHTNGGNYAAVKIATISSTSVTLQYVTYSTAQAKVAEGTATLGAAGVPVVSAVVNNYSNINPGAPNFGIAPGTLIVIYGSNLAASGGPTTLQNPSQQLPTTLGGSSVAVTVNGKTVQPGFYYAFPGQIAVVLPSSTPVGTGTITVTYNNQASAPFPLKVVTSAFGFDYYGGTLAAVTDNGDGHLINIGDSARPGETIVFWGAGLGADTKNSDLGPPTSFDNLNNISALYFGTVQVPIAYQGRSPYQGVDQVVVTVPSNAPTGCGVSVAAVSGSIVSNFVSIPISSSGGTCTDGSLSPLSATEGVALAGQGTVKFGAVQIGQITQPNMTPALVDSADAIFYAITGASLTGYQSSTRPSLGSCYVTQSAAAKVTSVFTFTGLNAGTVTVQGPVGSAQTLTTYSQAPGAYVDDSLPSGFIPSSGGTFTFNGSGGSAVGAFTQGVSMPSPLVWTNASSIGTINRSQGVTVNWTNGGTGYVEIAGGSVSTSGSSVFSTDFVCNAPASAGTFTVPPPVLLALPAGTGALEVGSYTFPQLFTVSGLDFAFGNAFANTQVAATYN
jgi:uncharacterized protein (TIGR03437 family)